MKRDKLKIYQAKNPKNQFLGKKTRLISRNKYFQISLISLKMSSAENLFGSTGLTPHSSLKRSIRNLKNTHWKKVLTLIRQTVFSTF